MASRVVNVDRLQPYVPHPYRLTPFESNNDNLIDQLVDEHESNSDTEQNGDESVLLANPMAMLKMNSNEIICMLPSLRDRDGKLDAQIGSRIMSSVDEVPSIRRSYTLVLLGFDP